MVLPRFWNHHQDSMWKRATTKIEQLKNFIESKHDVRPEDQNITIMTP
jgi:hypothetical protein